MSTVVLFTVGGYLPSTVVVDSESQGPPGADQVRVQVEAAPVDGSDWLSGKVLFTPDALAA